LVKHNIYVFQLNEEIILCMMKTYLRQLFRLFLNLFSVTLPLPKPTRLRPVDEKPLQKSEDKGKVY
jgi:hypothetical protein